MSISKFPHGLSSYGVPLLGGAGRMADIWAEDNLFFVDGTLGSNGNSGKEPNQAKSSISGAITAATKGAVIYVRPRTTTASAQTYYRDNITVPLTKPNLSIIGCGNQSLNSHSGVQLKVTATTTTGHLIDVKGAGLYLENMRLTGNSMTGTGCIVHANNSATTIGSGLHVNYCRFEAAVAEGSIASTDIGGGSIGLGSANEVLVENCQFFNCLSALHGSSTYGTFGRATFINNLISGAPGSRACDIKLTPGSGTYGSSIIIANNVFASGVPTTGTSRFISIVGTTTGIVSGNYFASTAAAGEYGSDGTDCIIPATFFFVGNYNEDGAIAGGT